jgi:citrate lyase subunit beta/citryl-CoA lyase
MRHHDDVEVKFMFRRSYLFVPGDRPDRFEKARQSGADAVIIDLEDAVESAHKDVAREAVASWLSPTRPVYVRINGTDTPWFEGDLEVVGLPGVLGVVLPKAEWPEQVAQVADRLTGDGRVMPLMETALSVWHVGALAQAPRVERLAFGSVDFQLDTGISGEYEELLYARSRLVMASRVASILPPVDGVTLAFEDQARLRDDVTRARRLGFGGKLCVHPQQVETINQGFAPTEAEQAWATRILEAVEVSGEGAFRLHGELIDRPVIDRARAILAQAEERRQQDRRQREARVHG